MFKFVSPHQWTPLHLAASSSHTDVVRLLVDKGANINSRDSGGVSKCVCTTDSGLVLLTVDWYC